ncbi:WXG100 family type VII secretion target [Mycolicibacterium komossense]|uniref:WXG100 family type VII secretion target n=2 Tax=Mycolicibacterium komossense TaxID=1779 RepID=A0ABT3CIB1_9MYCO|nr:WXG100 family type VII secretion target [Mycolicibacterium komossense]
MVGSAIHVTGQGEDLAAGHLASDNRMESAQAGWQGTSAIALAAKLADWQPKSKVLLARVADHAEGLHTSAASFAAMEEKNAQALGRLGAAADSITHQT